jgi:PAS domain-containing protein
MEYITQIVASALGFFGIAYGVYKTNQVKRYEIDTDRVRQAARHTTETDRRIDEKELSLTEKFLAEMRKEIDALREENNVLKEELKLVNDQLNSVKAGVLTMSLFGNDAPIAMWIKDKEGRRMWHNAAYEDMTGYDLFSSSGKTDLEITGDIAIAKAWAHNDDKVMSTKEPVQAKEPCAHRDHPEDIFDLYVVKFPRTIKGVVAGTEGAAIRYSDIREVDQ